MSDSSTILVRGVNWLGDAVMSTPALMRLREARPTARIALLTPEKLQDLWLGHPALDEVISIRRNESVFSVGRRLRRKHFETALLFPNSHRAALESWWAGIPRRIGLIRPWRNVFLTDRLPPREGEVPMEKRAVLQIRLLLETGVAMRQPEPPPIAHHIHQYLHLTAALNASTEPVEPFVHVADAEVAALCTRFNQATRKERRRPLIGINPGAEYGPAKRWPKERFVETAAEFTRQRECDWWVFGGPADQPLAEEIAGSIQALVREQGKATSLAGKTTLRELCAGLKAVDTLITNDSGPMHVAAAVGTPVVAVFGSTSPALTGPGIPGGTRHRLLREPPPCAPCFLRECPVDLRCLHGISSNAAVAALNELIPAR